MAVFASDDITASPLKDMEEELICNICFDLLAEPKDLECPHVFCLRCLTDWVGNQSVIRCPECRHVTEVPSGGISALKTNLRVRNMVEKFVARMEKQSDSAICPDHEGERRHFFCLNCEISVCQACLVLKHKMPIHNIKELKEVTVIQRTQIKTKIEQILQKIRKEIDEVRVWEDLESQVQKVMEREIRKVDQHLAKIKTEADMKSEAFKSRIQYLGQEHLQAITQKQKSINDRVKRLRQTVDATEKAVTASTDQQIATKHAWFVDKLDRELVVTGDTQRMLISNVKLEDLCFHQGPSLVGEWFGHIGVKVCQPSLSAEFGMGDFQYVQSIAKSRPGAIITVDQARQQVSAYHPIDGKYRHQFNLAGLIKPVDVAVLWNDDKIIVAESAKVKSDVKFFSASSGQCEVTPTTIKGNKVAASPDYANIVIGNSDTNTISIYTPNSELLKQCTFPIRQDGGTLKTNGKLIGVVDWAEGKVQLVHITELDFGFAEDMITMDVQRPVGICFDDRSGSVIIARSGVRFGEGVLEQFCCRTGRLITRLASDLCHPLSIIITSDDKLAVADMKSVKIYDIHRIKL